MKSIILFASRALCYFTCLTVASLCNRTEATLFYDFEENGTGTVFATLEVSHLPVSHEEINELTFTPAGEAKFYYGAKYPGAFDLSQGLLLDDGLGGLVGSEPETRIIDSNPPQWPDFFITAVQFVISAGPSKSGSLDQLLVDWDAPVAGPGFFEVYGHWRRVIPEPTSFALALAATLFFIGRRQR